MSVCQSHIFELLSMIHFAIQGTMYCPTTSSVLSVCLCVCINVCMSVCQSHIFELLSMIHFAIKGTMYCPTTSSVHQLN